MAQKKYASLTTLQTFLGNLRNTFAALSHTHKISELSDYTVDTTLSSTSNNPVANSVLDAEFEAIATSMNALDSALDDKAALTHASQHKSDGSDPISPSDIGAFPVTGGTITGKNLYLNNGAVRVFGDSNRLQLESYNVANDTSNRRIVHIRNTNHTESDIKDALALYDVVDGVQTIYKLYGEHNKPDTVQIITWEADD